MSSNCHCFTILQTKSLELLSVTKLILEPKTGNHIRTEGAPKQKEETGFSPIKTNGRVCSANRLAPVSFNMTEHCCDEKQHNGRISQLAIDRKWPQTDRTAAQTVTRPTCI